MKLKLFSIICFCFALVSCDSYLDKQPDDMQTIEGVFEKRTTTQQYLANVLSYLPHQWDNLCEERNSEYGWPFTPASDEAEWGAVRVYAQMQNGSHSASLPAINFWTPLYRGIRESNIFLENVAKCTELSEKEIALWSAEARYANIMCHYWLAMLYGPIILVKDELVDLNETIYRERDSWEDCVNWITTSLKEVAEELPAKQEEIYAGKPTKAAALAYRSRMLLYSASPLMNGNSYFTNTKKEDGTSLFSIEKDVNKWRIAADAAKEIIDLCESGTLPYGLLTASDDECKKGIAYKKVFTENWNKELLDTWDLGDDVYFLDLSPAPNGERFNGHATNCVTQQQVDAYAMSNGIYPITGYQRNDSPIIDETSGYSEVGFSTFTVPTFDTKNKGYTGEASNMYKDREPRFYASIAYNEGVWPNTSTDKPIYLNKYGTEGSSSFDYNRTGYLITKFAHPSSSTYNPYSLVWRRCWPNFRYAEIILNYVEAKIELGETRDALSYWNMVRKRAGVPNIETVYPAVTTDKDLATFLIRRERQVEFAFENIRWFDCNRWKISTKTNHGNTFGMNVNILNSKNMRAEYYHRTVFEIRIFKENQYLQPIPQSSIVKNPKLIQNPGW